MKNFEFKTSAWQVEGAAASYDHSTRSASKVFELVRQQLYIDYVKKHAHPGAKILDVGCGSGLIAIALHDLGFKVVAYDVSRDMLNFLHVQKEGRDIEIRHGDGSTIPADEGEFDLTLSRMFIQHFVDWKKILTQKAFATKVGGKVLFDFGNQEHLDLAQVSFDGGNGFPYDNDQANVASFYSVATADQMKYEASSIGLEVVEIANIGLLLYNGFLWKEFNKSGITNFDRRVGTLLEKDGAREMLMLIEREVLPLLPRSTTYGNITVLQRRI